LIDLERLQHLRSAAKAVLAGLDDPALAAKRRRPSLTQRAAGAASVHWEPAPTRHIDPDPPASLAARAAAAVSERWLFLACAALIVAAGVILYLLLCE
jgi:hypothetical protein